MAIISHRGGRGLATENTIEGVEIADKYHPKYIEFDIQKTVDKQLILFHNLALDDGRKIRNLTYAEILETVPHVPLMSDAINALVYATALIELKSSDIAQDCYAISRFSDCDYTSFIDEEISCLRQLDPNSTLFLMQHKHPVGLVDKAIAIKANGIGINKNYMLFLPFIFRKAKKHKLQVYVYTLNNRLTAVLLRLFYPTVMICTDYPNKII